MKRAFVIAFGLIFGAVLYGAEHRIRAGHSGKITFLDEDGYVISEIKSFSEERIFDADGVSLSAVSRAYVSANKKYAAVFRTVYTGPGASGRFSDIVSSELSLLYDNGEQRWKKKNIAPYSEFNLCFSRDGSRVMAVSFDADTLPPKVKEIMVLNANGSEAWKSGQYGTPGYMKLSPNGKFASFSYTRDVKTAGGAISQEAGCVFVDLDKKLINHYRLPEKAKRAVPNVTDQGKCVVTEIVPQKTGDFKVKQISEVLYEYTFPVL